MRAMIGILAFAAIVFLGVAILISEWIKNRRKANGTR